MPGILKGLLLLCVFSIAEASVAETGEFYCGPSDFWPATRDNPQIPGQIGNRFVKNVTFSTPFTLPPVVFLSVTYLNSIKFANLVFLTRVFNVSESWFAAMCFKWSDTKIIEMRVTWLAVSTTSLVKTGEFNCETSGNWIPVVGNPKYPDQVGKISVKRVRFTTKFNYAPVLVLSVTLLESDKSSNLRFLTQVENVSKSGFRGTCYTWADTQIWDMRVTWFAVPTDSLGVTGEFYCSHSNGGRWTSAMGNPKFPTLPGRRFVQNVKFPREFNNTPVVFLSVTYLDNIKLNDLRFMVQVDYVSESGFRAMCYTWSNTEIYDMRVTWFAI